MTDWCTDTVYFCFPDQAAFETMIAAADWLDPHKVRFAVRGVLYRDGAQSGVDPETGAPVYVRVALPGWHVDGMMRGLAMPEAMADYRRWPETPDYQFSGTVQGPDPIFTVDESGDEGVMALGDDDGALMGGGNV